MICRYENHEYHAVINTKTGAIFTDCRRRKIFVKNLSLLLIRPIHTICKTLFHIQKTAFLSLKILKKRELTEKNELKIKALRSFQDIARTPYYGTLITITHLAAIILGSFSPNTLYRTREIAGSLERKLLRVQEISEAKNHALSICFSPLTKILVDKNEGYNRENLKNFAEANVQFRKTQKTPCNDCFSLYPKDKTYISAAAKKISKKS